MTDPVEALILDLLDWLTVRERTYEEVMGAWRTSCPRLPVWEEANDRGLIMRQEVNGNSMIRVSSLGLALINERKAERISDDLPPLESHPLSSEQVTDHYLADLATRHGLKLATFDTDIIHTSAEVISSK